MTTKNILIIDGHPDAESLCASMALSYEAGAQKTGHKTTRLKLRDLDFELNLKYGYRQRTNLEPDLLKCIEKIKDADHLVFVYPVWWGTFPALLKGFIDRVFLPGITYQPKKDSLMWAKLLKGKSAHLLVTLDTPGWYFRLVYGRPGHNAMKKCVLQFCGVRKVKISTFSPIKNSKEGKRNQWLDQIQKMGIKGK